MRGEHDGFEPVEIPHIGSSPHARGALAALRWKEVAAGVIPACAGSTIPVWECRVGFGGHPRMRGEHSNACTAKRSLLGSSPHARGARRPARCSPRFARVIPACAGSTAGKVLAKFAAWGHPRMRGEHGTWPSLFRVERGSSPHARGAPFPARRGDQMGGVIPACAGSTGLIFHAGI